MEYFGLNLKDYFIQYKCNKSILAYHTVYESYFKPIRYEKLQILELGVHLGYSALSFLDYFPKSKIYGIDTFERHAMRKISIFGNDRVQLLKANSQDIKTQKLVEDTWPGVTFDIIIDDAEHTPEANMKTFNVFHKFLKPTGIYFIEDNIPMDLMTPKELNIGRIASQPHKFSVSKQRLLINTISEFNVVRHDLRDIAPRTKRGVRHEDATIIAITK